MTASCVCSDLEPNGRVPHGLRWRIRSLRSRRIPGGRPSGVASQMCCLLGRRTPRSPTPPRCLPSHVPPPPTSPPLLPPSPPPPSLLPPSRLPPPRPNFARPLDPPHPLQPSPRVIPCYCFRPPPQAIARHSVERRQLQPGEGKALSGRSSGVRVWRVFGGMGDFGFSPPPALRACSQELDARVVGGVAARRARPPNRRPGRPPATDRPPDRLSDRLPARHPPSADSPGPVRPPGCPTDRPGRDAASRRAPGAPPWSRSSGRPARSHLFVGGVSTTVCFVRTLFGFGQVWACFHQPTFAACGSVWSSSGRFRPNAGDYRPNLG